MRNRVASSWSSLFVAVLVLVVGWRAAAQPLADRVPGDALIYVGWAGSESMGPGYQGSHLQAVLDASKMSELVNQALPRIVQRIAASDPGAAGPMRMMSGVMAPMWRHASAF